MPDQPPSVTLRLLTRPPEPCRGYATGCVCAACEARIKATATLRSHCPACCGDLRLCMAGTSEPDFDQLAGCRVFTDEGKLRPLPAKPAPRQPWHVRPARKAA